MENETYWRGFIRLYFTLAAALNFKVIQSVFIFFLKTVSFDCIPSFFWSIIICVCSKLYGHLCVDYCWQAMTCERFFSPEINSCLAWCHHVLQHCRLIRSDLILVKLTALVPLHRYYATVHPLKKRITVLACTYLLSGIWLLSCGLVAPAVAHTYHVEFKNEGFTICEEFWMGQERERLAYAYSTLFITYVLPLSALCISYLCISVKLRNCVVPGHHTESQVEAQRVRKRKTFRLVSLVVAAFGICWMPISVFNVLRDIDIDLIDKRYFLLIQLLCHLCAMSSSCCNPFLYAWLHDRFRAELRKMFTCRRRIGISANNCATASMVLWSSSASRHSVHASFE